MTKYYFFNHMIENPYSSTVKLIKNKKWLRFSNVKLILENELDENKFPGFLSIKNNIVVENYIISKNQENPITYLFKTYGYKSFAWINLSDQQILYYKLIDKIHEIY